MDSFGVRRRLGRIDTDPPEGTDARRAVETLARESFGRLVAFLAARTRDVAAAEDALADALVAALASWPEAGVPEKPEAWLLATARRRLVDRFRKQKVRDASLATVELLVEEATSRAETGAFPDERLQLLFVCAHPAIDSQLHTPLMLQAVLGLDAAAIARAFLVSAAAMSQRLVRAKAKIRDAAVSFEIPEARELAPRLDAVLQAVYAAYANGWEDAAGTDAKSLELSGEAIRLARLLATLLPSQPETHGLLSLLLHCEARRSARRRRDGAFVPLSQQDARDWDAAMIEEAERQLVTAAALGRPGRFQLEAAIQSAHVERASRGVPDAATIVQLYDRLVELAPTVGSLVARAAAAADALGPEAGLARLDEIEDRALAEYQPHWALRAHLLREASRLDEAEHALGRAIALAADPAVRKFLEGRRG